MMWILGVSFYVILSQLLSHLNIYKQVYVYQTAMYRQLFNYIIFSHIILFPVYFQFIRMGVEYPPCVRGQLTLSLQ